MDALAALLDGPRARDAFLVRTVIDPPWALRVQDEAPLTVVCLVRGDGWVIHDEAPPVRLRAGDVAVIRGPDHYTAADDPSTPPDILIQPDGHCTTLDGQDLSDEMLLGVRTWGTNPDGATQMLTGTYFLESEVSSRLLAALPRMITLDRGELDSPLVALLASEIVKDAPGQEAVLDRLLDLLLIAALRAWFARPDAAAPEWYRAMADPVVGRALRLLHAQPARAWTVASLAHEVGVSRAALARQFGTAVGQPPMAYLTEWRLTLAADLLREPGTTLASVADQVGYGSAFALSAAFKRVRGVSPRAYLAAAA